MSDEGEAQTVVSTRRLQFGDLIVFRLVLHSKILQMDAPKLLFLFIAFSHRYSSHSEAMSSRGDAQMGRSIRHCFNLSSCVWHRASAISQSFET